MDFQALGQRSHGMAYAQRRSHSVCRNGETASLAAWRERARFQSKIRTSTSEKGRVAAGPYPPLRPIPLRQSVSDDSPAAAVTMWSHLFGAAPQAGEGAARPNSTLDDDH